MSTLGQVVLPHRKFFLVRLLDGVFHTLKSAKYAHRYLAEIMWRLKRCFDLDQADLSLLVAAIFSNP